LSVQFSSLPGLRPPSLFLFWSDALRAEFPTVEEHPTLPPVFERFDHTPSQPEIRLEMLHGAPPRRLWFINDAGTELVQVQHDRFIFNWRKIGEEPYPRYEQVREGFLKHYERLASFVQQQELGEISPNQCEVTYVNHITSGSQWKSHGDAANVFSFWRKRFSDTFLPKPASGRAALEFLIPSLDSTPRGRLHVSTEPAFGVEKDDPVFVFTLTARGAPVSDGPNGAMQFLNLGREWVVRGFTSLTTERMHREWKRTDGG
jgi:uncharacterized protein (TIGR04255 family)